MPRLKNAIFSIITVILVPLLFFVLIEFGLVVAGIGTSFNYFHILDIEGEPHYQENPAFADQFYPPALNIGPLNNTFARQRGPDSLRVYVLGGSAAMGFPNKNHGVDRHLAALLREALPGRDIEVINTAMTSVNSHVVYEVARSLPADSADFAVILMGNNEVVGPYGPGTFNQNFLSNLALIRGLQALKRTRLWQALDGLLLSLNPSDAKQELKWEGMQMFTNYSVPLEDPRMESVYRHYRENLHDIIDILRDKGLQIVLSSVPVNLRHSAPFASVQDPDLSKEQRDLWRELQSSAAQGLADSSWREATTALQAALEIDPGHADTHFQLATAYEGLGELQQAKQHYQQALDLDALRFRADSRINGIIHEVAAGVQDDGIRFVDTAMAFEQASLPYQPGWNLLVEHVHYDFPGNYILAAEIASTIISSLAGTGNFQPLAAADVAARIGYPNHETIDVMKNLQGMVEHPPFTGQSNYQDLLAFVSDKIDSASEEVGSPAQVIERRRPVVDAGLADWKLHFELAELNRYVGNRAAMYEHLQAVFRLYPHNRDSYLKMADALGKDGQWGEAIPYLERSLYYTRGDEQKIAETLGRLGTGHFKIGENEKATDYLLAITRDYSDQIGLTLMAYGNLIRHARDAGMTADLDRYVEDVQAYATRLKRQGKQEEFPLLSRRMSQIMMMAGNRAEARRWAENQPN